MKYHDSKRVLITGGAGFLGSHLCERLVGKGLEVLCVDNYFTGTKKNISHLLGMPNFELLRHDITFPLYIEADERPAFLTPAVLISARLLPVYCAAWPSARNCAVISASARSKRSNISSISGSPFS